jgi:hypothetical protein
MNKKCRRCEESKPLASFSKDKSRKDGLQSLCKECDSRKGREYYNANKEIKANYYRLRKGYKKYQRLKYKYNLSDIDYDTMVINQEGVCKICQKKDIFDLAVDHDHNCCKGRNSCGKCVRGLLCNRCNMALGAFDDDITKILKALDYLMSYKENK